MNWKFWQKKEESPEVTVVKPEPVDWEALYPYWPYKVVETTMKSGRKSYQLSRAGAWDDYKAGWSNGEYVNGTVLRSPDWVKFKQHESQKDACEEARQKHLDYRDSTPTARRDVSCD
jgi:hypothetical protein